jgi:hypothetical protein
MSAEYLTAIASLGTFVVIAATALAAFVQLRHMRGANSITALTECREVLESEEFAAAQRFVAFRLPEMLKDPQVRRRLLKSPIDEDLRQFNVVGNFFESLGSFIRNGIIDKEIACSLWCDVVVRNWGGCAAALAIQRRKFGPALWEQFEYLARISQAYAQRHPDGTYPRGVERMPLRDVWLEADLAAKVEAPAVSRRA